MIVKVLIIEDDQLCQFSLKKMLKETISPNLAIKLAADKREACERIRNEEFDIIFVDLDLSYPLEGIDFIQENKHLSSHFIILSGHSSPDIIALAYQSGAEDYLLKPIGKQLLNESLKRFRLKTDHISTFLFDGLTLNAKFQGQLKNLEHIVSSNLPILLQGESGTGKTHLALLIHQNSSRCDGPFIAINCSEISEDLIESELFGHVKGAFSGAITDRKGKLELADGGTIFLDELGSLSGRAQSKLLKAIEEKNFYPLGSEKLVKSDFRVVSASCEGIENLVSQNQFREDLYFRLQGYQLWIPPLRERREDIKKLVEKILAQSMRKIILSEQVWQRLESYHWPGNIRELKKVVETLLCIPRGYIQFDDLPKNLFGEERPFAIQSSKVVHTSRSYFKHYQTDIEQKGLKRFLKEFEEDLFKYYLESNEGHVRKTLKQLKISHSSFYRVLDRIKN